MNLYVTQLLSPEECAEMRAAFDLNAAKSEERDFSGQPVLRDHQFADAVRPILGKCVGAAIRVADERSATHSFWVLDTVILTRMAVCGWHEPHADNCRRNETGEWVPNHTPQRTHSAIVYLSTCGYGRGEFAGGELRFPDSGVTVSPREGMMALFPSDRHHVHEVRPLLGGYRYSLAIWLKARGA